MTATQLDAPPRAYLRRVLVAASVGATVEWYDFFLYGTAATLVFNKVFFPAGNASFASFASYASFGVAYVSRPLGGVIFGHFGDRIGRKRMLVLTLLIIGGGTLCIGLLPSYAAIGIWAPILLFTMRFLQGIGLGGEWGGAVLLAIENAPPGRRGLYGSIVQIGAPLGLVLGTLGFKGATQMPDATFLQWGWRIPFVASVLLLGLGYFIRTRLWETPAFRAVQSAGAEVALPIWEALKTYPRNVVTTCAARLSEGQVFNIFAVVVILYGTTQLDMPKSLVLDGVLLGAGLECFTLPLFGRLSDRIGRRPVFILGAAFSGAFAFPAFDLLDTRTTFAALAVPVLGFAIGHSAMFAAEATFFTEVFPTKVRYSGSSFVYQFSGIASSGIVPAAAAALITAADGGAGLVAVFVIGYAVLSVLGAALTPETYRRSLEDPPGAHAPAPADPARAVTSRTT